MNNKSIFKEQVEKVGVTREDIDVDNTLRQTVYKQVTDNYETCESYQERNKKSDNIINHVTVSDRSVDIHLYNDVQTIDEVSSECL